MRIRVKICGITRAEDALFCVAAGVDAIGLVFYEKSPRYVSVLQAERISRKVPAFVSRVALFKDADSHTVETVLQEVEVDLLQFHGNEPAGFCEQFDRPYIKALGMKTESATDYLHTAVQHYASAKALLLDAHAPGEAGGTGETFNWNSIAGSGIPLILAGGLTANNVREAIRIVQPYAVDVSSGVESSPGVKDREKITAFMQQLD